MKRSVAVEVYGKLGVLCDLFVVGLFVVPFVTSVDKACVGSGELNFVEVDEVIPNVEVVADDVILNAEVAVEEIGDVLETMLVVKFETVVVNVFLVEAGVEIVLMEVSFEETDEFIVSIEVVFIETGDNAGSVKVVVVETGKDFEFTDVVFVEMGDVNE